MQAESSLPLQPEQPKKKSYQFKALLYKSASLQSKQIGTNVCQILTPIICLLFTFIIKKIADSNLNFSQDSFPYPLPFNTAVVDPLASLIGAIPPQWYLFKSQNPNDYAFIGTNDGFSASTNLLQYFPGNKSLNVLTNVNGTNETLNSPFLRQSNFSTINLDLAYRLTYLNDLKLGKGLDFLPDGAISFQSVNSSYIFAKLFINDCRNYQYHRQSGTTIIYLRASNLTDYTGYVIVPEGQLQLLDSINVAYIQNAYQNSFQSGVIYMPNASGGNILVDSLINLVAATIFPLSLSLLFPVFLYAIVLQKQQKLIQMMKMNGMRMISYWSVTFVFNLTLSVLTNAIFFLFGYFMLNIGFFTKTAPSIVFLVLFGWILAQIGMATLFQTILSNSRSANIIGYLFSIWTSLIGASLSVGVYSFPGTTFPIILQIISFFGFPRAMYILLSQCSLNTCITTLQGAPQQLKTCIMFLYINFIIFFLLGIYLQQIIPQQFGIANSPLFPYYYIRDLFIKKQKNSKQIQDDQQLKTYIADQDQQDQFSKQQRTSVKRLTDLQRYPLVCNNLRKLYQKQGRTQLYAAVKSFNLAIQPNQIFGLLGPNGAGKTTLISMITGMYQPNYGNAWVSGYSIREDIQKVHLQMGVCPQFDLLWPQLTIQQHLYFYARLKGVSRADQDKLVQESIAQVNLEKFRTFKARQLSGGMKRRLSVAISMVGNPKIVFLDQPTTGLDPDNRRSLWTVLARCKQKRAMFLTTHMMDEADALCNRIGIITNGVLRTVANQIKLRNIYGGGYRLDIYLQKQHLKLQQSEFDKENLREQDEQEIRRQSQRSQDKSKMLENEQKMKDKIQKLVIFISEKFPTSRLLKIFNGNFKYNIGKDIIVSKVFEVIEKRKKQYQIAYWGITNSSLEDVFMAVVQKYDKQQILQQDLKRSLRKSLLIRQIEKEKKQIKQLSEGGSIHRQDP